MESDLGGDSRDEWREKKSKLMAVWVMIGWNQVGELR